jgi:hypothetical protein
MIRAPSGYRQIVSDSVMVCKKCKDSKCLAKFFKTKTDVKVLSVGCQKICHGPVAGTQVAGRTEWFERVGKAKPMVALARLASDGTAKLPHALEKRRVPKHSGRPPR